MRKLQTNKAEVRDLVIGNGNSVTTCDAEAAQVLCDHFQQSFTIEKRVDDCMHDEMKPACSLANVNSRSRSLYAIARPSVVCLSVCRL